MSGLKINDTHTTSASHHTPTSAAYFPHRIKELLIPFSAHKFGYPDGLSVDASFKHVWSKISRTGGAGGNAEETAMKGIIKDMALRPHIVKLQDERQMRAVHLQFALAPSFQYHTLSSEVDQEHYQEVLLYMFGGKLGCVLTAAAQFLVGGAYLSRWGVTIDDFDLTSTDAAVCVMVLMVLLLLTPRAYTRTCVSSTNCDSPGNQPSVISAHFTMIG